MSNGGFVLLRLAFTIYLKCNTDLESLLGLKARNLFQEASLT